MLGPNGIKKGVHKFVLAALQRTTRASAVSLGSLAMSNICFKLWKIGQKWPKTSKTQRPPFGHFIKTLREAVH